MERYFTTEHGASSGLLYQTCRCASHPGLLTQRRSIRVGFTGVIACNWVGCIRCSCDV
jgi:hypothetical protein